MKDPAVGDREIGDRQGEIWIELDGPLVELNRFIRFRPVFDRRRLEIVGLDKGEIGFAVLGWLASHPRLFTR